jgi:AbrB family looped-hinge helix DNA binding protein
MGALDKSKNVNYFVYTDQSEFSEKLDQEDQMAKLKLDNTRATSGSQPLNVGCCKIDALVSVDARGQLVLPKELRERAGIEAGDKLAIVSWEREGEVCCITLMKADEFAGTVKTILGPIMKEILE